MCPYSYYSVMRTSKDAKYLRLKMVLTAEEHGIKRAARDFGASRNTVRKWLHRWHRLGYPGLTDQSRRPHRSPKATPAKQRRRLVALKRKYSRLGAEAIRTIEGISISAKTIRKIWREEGVSSRKRRKKHQTKQNLRELKKQWALFQQVDEDTKDLKDIPEYWIQMKQKGLPAVQYTARDVTTGMLFMGFAQERSLDYATCFARYLNNALTALGVDLSNTTRQSDNGSEYVGSWQAKEDSSYTKTVQSIEGQQHQTIPPGAHRFQSDVETVHNLVEIEFYEIEKFRHAADFLDKAYSYQLFFNLKRPNSYKENKTPWQLATEKNPNLSPYVPKIPPVLLDDLYDQELESTLKGGHDVPTAPFSTPTAYA
jgi:transposase